MQLQESSFPQEGKADGDVWVFSGVPVINTSRHIYLFIQAHNQLPFTTGIHTSDLLM